MSTLAYEIVDVFTDRPFAGNPLAVVFGAEALAGDQMQTLAREFNLSETVFVLPPTSPDGRLPGPDLHAGDGAAVRRAPERRRRGDRDAPRAGRARAGGAGVRRRACCRSQVTDAGPATLTGGTPDAGRPARPGAVAGPGRPRRPRTSPATAPPRPAGCGLEFVFLPVRQAALARAMGRSGARRAAGGVADQRVRLGRDARTAHARVFCPGVSVPGGPGDRLGGAGARRVAGRRGLAAGRRHARRYTVHQGIEMTGRRCWSAR